MDKKTFLEELKKSLRVLKEEELQDIIGEYEQHIDMKVKNGLTVEQAIADFGNVKELAAEILEAYHVRAEYSLTEGTVLEEPVEQNLQEFQIKAEKPVESPEREEKFKKFRHMGSPVGKRVRAWIGIGCGAVWKFFGWCRRQVVRPFAALKEMGRLWKEKRSVEQPENGGGEVAGKQSTKRNPLSDMRVHTAGLIGRTGKGISVMVGGMWRLLLCAALWCIRFFWNCCFVGFALFSCMFGLMALFANGVLAVLWMQGYPLAGLTLGCMGVVLCLFAAAALSWTLLWRKQRKLSVEMEEGQHA